MNAQVAVTTGRIIVADDLPIHRAPLAAILSEAGYEVLTAANGREVLDKVVSFVPDLFILDVDMPELDGFETCCCLKDDPQFQDIPIIFMSAESGISAIDCAFELGGNDFLAKPFNREEMLVRVRAHLRSYHERKRYRDQVLANAQALGRASHRDSESNNRGSSSSGGMGSPTATLSPWQQDIPVQFRFRNSSRESRTSDVLSLLGGTYLRAKRSGISLTMPRRPDDFTLAIAPTDLKRLLDRFSNHFLTMLYTGCGCHVILSRREPGEVYIQFKSDLKSYADNDKESAEEIKEFEAHCRLPDDLARLAGSLGAWAEMGYRNGRVLHGEIVLPAQF
jgi:CheY-like chemotaxis protein